MDYWEECISEALEEAKLSATKEQIDLVVSWVEGAHENYGLATGNDVADSNFISEEARELAALKAENEKTEMWVLSTKPCKSCTTNGWTLDGWGRDQRCYSCDGKGRVNR